MSGQVRAARRRDALGLPRVSDREAERRLKDNRALYSQTSPGSGLCSTGGSGHLGSTGSDSDGGRHRRTGRGRRGTRGEICGPSQNQSVCAEKEAGCST